MREVFEEDDDYENNSPVLLSVPQLEGPIVFTKEALKNWGSSQMYSQASMRSISQSQSVDWYHSQADDAEHRCN